MGFFSNVFKSINPVEQVKNPKKTFKTMATASVDPGGTLIRTGRGVEQNWQNTVDPLNATIAAPPKKGKPFQGLESRGMFMGQQGPTIKLPNNTPRTYATAPFSMGGGAAPSPAFSPAPTGVAPPTRLPSPAAAPAPMPVNPATQPPRAVMSSPKMNPQLQQQMLMANSLRGGR